MLYLAAGSTQHLYQGIQNNVVIGLLNIYWNNKSHEIITNSICIVFLSIVYIVSIKEEIIPNPPFQFSGTSLVILSFSRNVVFGDTRQVLLIGSYFMCSKILNECVLAIEMNEPL